jgi:PIN domain nuclease of toxin-antitoxin system
MRYVLDAHALVWFLTGDARLGDDAKRVLSDPKSDLILPAIALAEACWIAEHGKVAGHSSKLVFDVTSSDPRVTIAPMTEGVVLETLGFTGVGEMHDRQIVATARLFGSANDLTLITRDRNIVASGLVPTTW